MKITFKITEKTQIKAVKVFTSELDKELKAELDVSGTFELPTSVNLTILPNQEYDVHLVDEDEKTVTIWLDETLHIPDYPKENICLIS